MHHLALKKLTKLPTKKKKGKKERKKERKKIFRVSAQYPFTDRNSWISPIRPVFFVVRNKGVICTGLLAGTVYTEPI